MSEKQEKPSPEEQVKRTHRWDLRSPTNFYPKYGEGRDLVNPVTPVASSNFQEVIPRYELSSSDTRDEGLGPSVNDLPATLAGSRNGSNHCGQKEKKEDAEETLKEQLLKHYGRKTKKKLKSIRTNFWT